jgi:PHP family Zn ribbon phosphoesterase
MEMFLEAQKEKWKCPKCGGPVCLHNGICFCCELEKLKVKKRKFRWEETDEPKP